MRKRLVMAVLFVGCAGNKDPHCVKAYPKGIVYAGNLSQPLTTTLEPEDHNIPKDEWVKPKPFVCDEGDVLPASGHPDGTECDGGTIVPPMTPPTEPPEPGPTDGGKKITPPPPNPPPTTDGGTSGGTSGSDGGDKGGDDGHKHACPHGRPNDGNCDRDKVEE